MATKTAFVTQVGKNSTTFAARSGSRHWLMIDNAETHSGNDAGPRAKELLLAALAGCTGSDVASILTKKRVPLAGFDMNVTAEETEDHPKVFTSMHLEYVFHGNGINVTDVERAIELSLTKYCGVTAMLSKAMTITHSYRIVPTD
jgi:putative redox protein